MSDKKLIAIAVAAIVIVAAVAAVCAFTLTKPRNNDNITGMYNISEYHQYSIDNGKLIVNYSGDGAYDTEFIEITSCSDGIFSGYCCVPSPGEKNPKHYPILGTYDSQTGAIQYTCSYDYPSAGLYDWVHGSIKNGVMHLSGFTFGDKGNYYASFQFTFIKKGCEKQHVSFEPIFNAGDRYSSFKVLKSLDKEEKDSTDTVSFDVKQTSDGLYYMNFKNPNSFQPVDLVGATIADGLIMGIGYENGKAFSVLMSKQSNYIQVNREYANGEQSATWTAYLTKDGKSVPVKTVPEFKGISFQGTSVVKNTAGAAEKGALKMTLTTLSNSLIEIKTDKVTMYGNVIPYGEGYIIAISESHIDSSGVVYYFGFEYLNKDMNSLTYSGLYMSANGELNAMYYKGQKI